MKYMINNKFFIASNYCWCTTTTTTLLSHRSPQPPGERTS